MNSHAHWCIRILLQFEFVQELYGSVSIQTEQFLYCEKLERASKEHWVATDQLILDSSPRRTTTTAKNELIVGDESSRVHRESGETVKRVFCAHWTVRGRREGVAIVGNVQRGSRPVSVPVPTLSTAKMLHCL